MISILNAIILGLVQGLTEFVPISSSGHLVLARELFNIDDVGILFDAILHLGTLLAVVIYLRSHWIKILRAIFKKSKTADDRKQVWLGAYITLATIPAVIVGLLFREQFETVFNNVFWVAIFLLALGVIIIVIELALKNKKLLLSIDKLSGQKAFGIGLLQAAALLPGVSRSGITILGGMIGGLTRKAAAEFSFLLSIPIILGAGIVSIFDLASTDDFQILPAAIGFLAAFISGWFAIKYLLAYLSKGTLLVFGIYMVVLGAIILIFV